ncbi:unnamed protein product [Absidia cylindrospora]
MNDKPIQITTPFANHRFFENHLPKDWNFKNFVIWKGYRLPLPPNNNAKELFKEYINSLNTLLKKKILPTELQAQLGLLKGNTKQTNEVLLELQQQPATVTINAETVAGNVYGTVSQVVEQQRQPQQQPAQQEQQPSAQQQQQQQQPEHENAAPPANSSTSSSSGSVPSTCAPAVTIMESPVSVPFLLTPAVQFKNS